MREKSCAVTCSAGSGQPLELVNTVLVTPICRAVRFIMSAQAASVPATPSASTTQASLPDRLTMPLSRFFTITCSPGDRLLAEAAERTRKDEVEGTEVHVRVNPD